MKCCLSASFGQQRPHHGGCLASTGDEAFANILVADARFCTGMKTGASTMMEDRPTHLANSSGLGGAAGRSGMVCRACQRKHNIVNFKHNIGEYIYAYIYIYIYIICIFILHAYIYAYIEYSVYSRNLIQTLLFAIVIISVCISNYLCYYSITCL